MNKRQMQKWVKALRSGKYRQGMKYLKNNNKHCCLGVLCEINKIKQTDYGGHVSFDGMTTKLDLYKKLLGVSCIGMFEKPIRVGGKRYSSLATMNDVGVPFSKIADVIEKHYRKLK